MTAIVIMLVLLNVACYGAAIYFYRRDQRRDQTTLAMLLENHRRERMTDQERVDSLVAALANSKGVSYVAPSRGYSNELIPTPTYFGKPDQRYWDIPRPVVDHIEEVEGKEEEAN